MQKGGVGRPKLLKNAVLALMFMTADVSKPSFYPLQTMTSSIFMPYSLAQAVPRPKLHAFKHGTYGNVQTRKWYEGMVV